MGENRFNLDNHELTCKSRIMIQINQRVRMKKYKREQQLDKILYNLETMMINQEEMNSKYWLFKPRLDRLVSVLIIPMTKEWSFPSKLG